MATRAICLADDARISADDAPISADAAQITADDAMANTARAVAMGVEYCNAKFRQVIAYTVVKYMAGLDYSDWGKK